MMHAIALAADVDGYFVDQFMYAERATDWRGNNNIAESIFYQMEREPWPVPGTIVMSAGTGGTSALLAQCPHITGHCLHLIIGDARAAFGWHWCADG